MRILVSIFFCAFLTACGVVNYDAAPEGDFAGSLLVMWVDDGNDLGSGRFVFVPSRTRPLTFTRRASGGSITTIAPDMMYTDGGSIPRQAQLFSGFSPWGYAPAYMVHDWIFVARHCLNDGTPTDDMRKFEKMTFQESAEVIAEAIKTLTLSGRVKEHEIASHVISGIVSGPISYQRWIVKGACEGDIVSKDHRDEVNAALDRRAGIRTDLRRAPRARFVAELSF
ncbi:hypothetical protein ACXYMO_09805 [Arenibacterium sp. CAU 1754]